MPGFSSLVLSFKTLGKKLKTCWVNDTDEETGDITQNYINYGTTKSYGATTQANGGWPNGWEKKEEFVQEEVQNSYNYKDRDDYS